MKALRGHLDDAERTVGTHLNLSHEAPTVPGSTVHVEVELADVDGPHLGFAVRAVNPDGTVVCRGSHRRAVIDLAHFEANARAHQP
jgi:fluoroacetyl-CoA thioesterase